MYNFIQGSPGDRWKRVWITLLHKFVKVGIKMPRKLRQTNKSWGSYGSAILWKNYLDRQVGKKRKGKIWPNVHILPWRLSQELQWDILCRRQIIWFFKNKNWPKDIKKTYGSRQNIAVVIGNKAKFQKTIFYILGILSHFLWKQSRWSSNFSEFRLMTVFFHYFSCTSLQSGFDICRFIPLGCK